MLTISYQYPHQLVTSDYTYGYTGDAADIDDPQDACDNQATYLVAHAYRDAATDTYGKFHFTLTPPPQNVLISKLSLYVRCFTTAGTDYWSGDACTIRGHLFPAGASSDYAGDAAQNFVNHWNQNQQPGGPSAVDFYKLGDWLTNPFTTASWTLQDLATLQVAFEVYIQSGETAQGGLVGGVVTQLYVRLECAPTAANLEPMRALGSLHLRLFRAPGRKITTVHGLEALDVPILGEVEADHYLAPTPRGNGWRQEVGSRPRLVVVGKRIDLMNNKVSLDHIDMLDASCTFWASFLQDVGFTTDYQGIPVAHLGGGGPVVARNQVNYVQRPGDELVVDVPVDVMKTGKNGLAVEGEVKNWLLNSCFGLGSGAAFTSWTVVTSGGGGLNEGLAKPFVDVTGQRRAVFVACGPVSGEALVEQSATVSGVMRVVVWYEYVSPGATPSMGINIRRLDNNDFWNDPAGAWDAGGSSSIVFPVTTGKTKWVSKPFTTGGSTTIRVRAGLPNSVAGVTQSGRIYSCELITCGDTAFPPAAGTPIVTTSAVVTRLKDDISIPNPPGARIWDHRFGRLILTLEPNWHDAALATNQEKVLISVAGLPSGAYMMLLYERVSSVSYWTLRFYDGSTTLNIRLSTSGHAAVVGQRVTLGALWTSALNEMGHGASVARLWLTDVAGTVSTPATAKPAGWDALAMAATSKVWLCRPGGAAAAETYPDSVYQRIDLDTIVPETDSLLRWMGAQ